MTVLVESTGRAEVRRRGSPCDQVTLDASGCRPVHVSGGNTCTRFARIARFKRGGRMLFSFPARCESGWNHGRAEEKESAEKDREGAFNTGAPNRALTAQDIFRPKRQSPVSPPIERTIQAARPPARRRSGVRTRRNSRWRRKFLNCDVPGHPGKRAGNELLSTVRCQESRARPRPSVVAQQDRPVLDNHSRSLRVALSMCRKKQRKLLTPASDAVSTSTAVNAYGLRAKRLRREQESSEEE